MAKVAMFVRCRVVIVVIGDKSRLQAIPLAMFTHPCPIHPHYNNLLNANSVCSVRTVHRVEFQSVRFLRIIKSPCGPESGVYGSYVASH